MQMAGVRDWGTEDAPYLVLGVETHGVADAKETSKGDLGGADVGGERKVGSGVACRRRARWERERERRRHHKEDLSFVGISC